VLSPFLSLCFAGLFCLAPVSFYLCWLASVNRRDRPTVVAGGWDFAAVLLALSGCLIAGGVLLLSLAANDGRLFTGGSFARLRETWGQQWAAWLFLLVGYAALLGIVAAAGAAKRRHSLAVYNLDADTAGRVVGTALERSGLGFAREGDLWVEDNPAQPGGRRLVEAKTFHGTAHTTIRLLCPHDRQREEIERHLRSELASTDTGPGPAAPWFTSIASGSVVVVVGFVGLIAYVVFFGR
jgi:hypothetical protein